MDGQDFVEKRIRELGNKKGYEAAERDYRSFLASAGCWVIKNIFVMEYSKEFEYLMFSDISDVIYKQVIPTEQVSNERIILYLHKLRNGSIVMAKTLDFGIVVREFELQSRYYVHFRTNTVGKGMNPLILPAMG